VWPPNTGSGPQFEETVYISEVNGAKKVKSNAQVAINKNSDPVHNFFLSDGWEDSAPKSFSRTSGIVRNESSYEADVIRAAG